LIVLACAAPAAAAPKPVTFQVGGAVRSYFYINNMYVEE